MQLTKTLHLHIFIGIALGVLFLFLRVFQLDVLPTSFAHDEIYYAAESQTIRHGMTDLTGNWRPWSLTAASSLYAELPGTVISLGQWIAPKSIAGARLSSALVGTLLPFLLGAIAYKLSAHKTTFWATVLIAGFNPWLFQFSRMSFDAILSIFFYSLGFLVLLSASKWQKLWSILPFAIGFYQYQGLKLILVPLIGSFLLYEGIQLWQRRSKSTKKHIVSLRPLFPTTILLVLCVLVFGSFLLRLQKQSSASRVNDLIFFRNEQNQQQVNDQRRLSLPSPITSVMNNKFVVISTAFVQKYTSAFDISQIFARGEPFRNPFSVSTFGMFYILDLIFVVIGLGVLWKKPETKASAFLLLLWLLIAPLPVAINAIDNWLMFRAAWFIPTLVLASGIGAAWVWRNYRLISLPVVGTYLLLVGLFGYHYWYRYPLYSAAERGFSERIMASYVDRLDDQQPVKILANESTFVFEAYLVYRHLITSENLPAIHQAFQNKKFVLGQTEVDTRCFNANDQSLVTVSEASNTPCDSSVKTLPEGAKRPTTIASLIDSGAIYRIYNDPLCTQFSLRSYAKVDRRQQLNIEQLSNQEFCETYLSYQD